MRKAGDALPNDQPLIVPEEGERRNPVARQILRAGAGVTERIQSNRINA